MTGMNEVLALMERAFRDEPFHNLNMLYGDAVGSQVPGGTCSDKALSFVLAARDAELNATLCTAFIGGDEIHRLARLIIDGRVYFADVGNGWPSLLPYPADEAIKYERFGMTFRTQVHDDRLRVFHRKDGKEYLQMEIMLALRPEGEIIAEIKNRFNSGIIYPFQNRMRFSAIVDDQFRFLRDNKLVIYGESGLQRTILVSELDLERSIHRYFRQAVDFSPTMEGK